MMRKKSPDPVVENLEHSQVNGNFAKPFLVLGVTGQVWEFLKTVYQADYAK